MLLRELFDCDFILTESGNPVVSGYELMNTRHIFQRADERGINHILIKKVLQRLGWAKREIEDPQGQQHGVTLYDSRHGFHVVLKKLDDDKRKAVKLLTVTVGHQYTGSRALVVKVR